MVGSTLCCTAELAAIEGLAFCTTGGAACLLNTLGGTRISPYSIYGLSKIVVHGTSICGGTFSALFSPVGVDSAEEPAALIREALKRETRGAVSVVSTVDLAFIVNSVFSSALEVTGPFSDTGRRGLEVVGILGLNLIWLCSPLVVCFPLVG